MKARLVTIGVSMSILVSSSLLCGDAQLIGYWKLNDSESIVDSSAYGWTATNKGATFSSSGRLNGAYCFDGTSDMRLNAPLLTNLPLTVELWVRAQGTQPAGVQGYYNIINNDKFGSGGHGIGINNSRGLYLNRRGSDLQGWTTGCTLPSGQWAHVAAVFEATQITLYTNGALYNTWSHSSTEGLSVGEAFTRVGRRNEGSSDRFKGCLDEMRVWAGVRTAQQIAGCFECELDLSEPMPVVTPTSLHFSSDQDALTLSLGNGGGSNYSFTITESADWLAATPTTGSVSNESQSVLVQVDRSGLATGTYSHVLTIDASVTTFYVNVTMDIALPPSSELIGYWKLNQSNAVIDSSVYEWSATNAGAQFTSSGRLGGAYYFDGFAGLTLNAPVLTGLPITIEAWVSPEGTQPTNVQGWYNIINNDMPWHGGHGMGINNDCEVHLNRRGYDIQGWKTDCVLPYGQWSHVAAVYKDTEMILYTNGALYSSWSHSSTASGDPGELYTRVGWRNEVGSDRFKGYLDEIRVWSGQRSSADIATYFDQELPDTSPPRAPTGVSASDGDYTNKVEIVWSDSEDATKYTVYRNTINNSSAAVDVSGEISTTRYDDVSVTSERVYYYWVKAGDSNGWSGFSDSDSGYAGAGFAAPTLSPSFIDFSSNLTTRFIYLGNDGTLPYTFTASVSAGSAWLSVLPDNGTVSNETIALSATADRSSLGDGTYEGYITVSPSVGDQFAVTAQVVVAGNTVVAEANGPYATDQGSPVTFSAAGSQGNALLYRWEVDALITPYSSEYASYTYTNTMVPGTYDVLLTVRDTNSPPHIAADSTTLTINNVPPTVDIGGPYQGSTTNPVFFAATVTDPGLLDAHEYRWDFENDGTWDTGWLNSNTIAHTYTAGGNYLVQCEARDNHGGVGSDSATVIVDQPNVPPVADAVIHGTTQTETNLPGLGYTVTLDGSGSYDPDAKPLPLYYDWREDVENPVKPLILESNRHDQIVTTQPLTKPGVYQFHLVVFDGEYNSEPATVTVRVPGWEGEVICDGFMAKVPLWGVNVIVSNTYTHQMDDSSRTDTEGYFLADSGAGYQVARLSRRDRDQFKPINIDTAGTFTENIYFLPNYYIYAGQVVTGSPGNYVGMMDVEVEVLLGNGLSSSTDLLGAFGFGSIPESWPLDGAPYKVRVQKEGFKSEVHDLLLTMDRNSEMILMTPSAGMIDVSGTVYSAQSGLPVEEVAVDFGCGWCVTSGADGAYGPVAMPEGEYAVKLSRDGFDDTYAYPPELNASTELNLAIEGGEVSVYGVVYDGSGMVITDATISVVESVSGLRLGSSTGATGEKATGAGYFDVTVAKGARTLVISAPGYESTEMSLDVNDHTKRNVILIPEPCLMTFVCLALGLLLRRIQID